MARTGGFGNRYYRAGSFRAANGRTMKLYKTGARRLVLLPPADREGMPILLEVTDPDAFVARVRQAWEAPDTTKSVNK